MNGLGQILQVFLSLMKGTILCEEENGFGVSQPSFALW